MYGTKDIIEDTNLLIMILFFSGIQFVVNIQNNTLGYEQEVTVIINVTNKQNTQDRRGRNDIVFNTNGLPDVYDARLVFAATGAEIQLLGMYVERYLSCFKEIYSFNRVASKL